MILRFYAFVSCCCCDLTVDDVYLAHLYSDLLWCTPFGGHSECRLWVRWRTGRGTLLEVEVLKLRVAVGVEYFAIVVREIF
jgi:hypothetical protein